MPTRVLVAYVLILLIVIGAGYIAWRMIHYSERAVRRRDRQERRARYHAEMDRLKAEGGQSGEANSPDAR